MATQLVQRDRRQHVGGAHVPRRHAPAPRRQPGRARAVARRLPELLRAVGADLGVPGAHQRRASSPATPRSGRGSSTLAHEFVYLDPFPEEWRREVRRMKARDRERANPARRGSAVPPQARPRLVVGHRVHGAARATRARARASRGSRAVDAAARSQPSSASARSAPRTRQPLQESFVLCERARNYRYLLTGSPSDALPADGDGGREARPHARLHPSPAAVAARRLPPRDPAGPRSSSGSSMHAPGNFVGRRR